MSTGLWSEVAILARVVAWQVGLSRQRSKIFSSLIGPLTIYCSPRLSESCWVRRPVLSVVRLPGQSSCLLNNNPQCPRLQHPLCLFGKRPRTISRVRMKTSHINFHSFQFRIPLSLGRQWSHFSFIYHLSVRGLLLGFIAKED